MQKIIRIRIKFINNNKTYCCKKYYCSDFDTNHIYVIELT